MLQAEPNANATVEPSRLVLCLDGTWNTPEANQITNIVRIRNLIDAKFRDADQKVVVQRVLYESGIGTEGNPLQQVLDGATGGGLEDNVRGAYRFLSGAYRPGLELYIFGFSRGAFTARSLVGYLGASGLLRPENCTRDNEDKAWAFYRTPPKFRYPSRRKELNALSFENVRVKLLGVFDTVGSRGIPVTGPWNYYNVQKYGFHDVALGANVDHALHALAIDEKRWSFPASIWEKPNHEDNETVEQVWFAGNHGNIGGGYEDESLSSIALEWMLSRIEEKKLGLQFVPDWQSYLKKDPLGPLADETKKLLFSAGRLNPTIRTINQCPANGWGRNVGLPPHAIPIGETLHLSALERFAEVKYRPPNLGSALDALSNARHLIQVTGERGQPLRWFENEQDEEELNRLLPASIWKYFERALRIIKTDRDPKSTTEEAKRQANEAVS